MQKDGCKSVQVVFFVEPKVVLELKGINVLVQMFYWFCNNMIEL